MPGLYGNVGNQTVSGGNTTGLYSTATPVQIQNNLNVNNINATGNIYAAGTIQAGGNITAPNFIGNVIGNISGNIIVPGNTYEVIFNDNGTACSSPNLTFDTTTLSVTGNIDMNSGYIINVSDPIAAQDVATKNYVDSQLSSSDFTVSDGSNNSVINNGDTLTFSATPNETTVIVGAQTVTIGLPNSITLPGNVNASYFIGNGALLTGVAGAYGNADVQNYLASGTNTGNIITTGNISGTYILGDGSQLTNLPAGILAGNLTGNIEANGFSINNLPAITTAGNVSGNYILGNGAFLTGVAASYGNANVANFLANYGSNTISTTGNITAGYFIGDGSQLTNLPAGILAGNLTGNINGNGFGISNIDFISGNGSQLASITGSNVTGAVANATYAVTAGHATTANTVTDAAQANITSVGTLTSLTVSGDAQAANLIATNKISVIGTGGNIVGADYITANYFVGDGSQLSNITATLSGNLSGNINANGFYINNLPAITTTGNITANYFIGNGSQLTGIASSYGNANVADFLANGFGSNSITTTGNISSGNLTATSVVYTPQIESSTSLDLNTPSEINANGNLRVGDNNANAQIATHGTGDLILRTHAGDANQGNIRIYDGASGNIDVTTNGTGKINLNGAVFTTDGITATGNVSAAYVFGNGSGLTSITGANVTGTVANATYATSAGSATTATTAATVTGNAQANITSVGTLTSLSVTGNTTSGNLIATGTVKSGAVTYTATDGTAGQVLTTYGNGITYFSTVSGGSYGNANVADFLANGFGSNTIVTTGNIDMGNININGRIYDTSGVFQVNSVGNIVLVPTGSTNIQSNLDVTGNIFNSTGANVIIDDDLYITGGATGYPSLWIGSVELNNNSGAPSSLNVNTNGASFSGTIQAGGNITAPYFIGNGNTLSNVTASFLNGNLTGNLNANGFNIFDSTSANVSIQDDLNVSGNIYTGSLKSVWVGSVEMVNNSGAPAGMIIRGGVDIDGNLTAKGGILNNGNLYIEDQGGVRFADADNSNYVALRGPAVVASDLTFTLPNSYGSNTQVLTSDGSGGLSWSTAAGGNTFSTIDANGTSIVADSSSDTLTFAAGSGITITGNATSDTITIAASGGGGTPGGSDTQIQFNDSSTFAGNAQMTFSKTTGNVAFGNLVIKSTNPNSAAVITNVNTLNPTARPLLGRVAIGAGFDGDWGNTGDYFNTTRNSAVAVMNRFVQTSTSNTTPMIGQGIATWFDNAAGGTVTSAGNVRGVEIDTYYTGSRWGNQGSPGASVYNGALIRAVMGNGSTGGSVGLVSALQASIASNSTNATINDNIGVVISNFATQSGANHGNVSGVSWNMNSSNPTVGNVYLLHNQVSGSGTHGANWGMGGNYRSANRYFMLRNDDDAAQVKLGSLRTYHEFLGNATQSTSSITIGPRQGPGSQVVRTTPTEAITSVTFTGFITSASDGTNTDWQTDTMTWIIQQGATPYAITMPTGNAQIKYAGGVSTIGTTANAVTMCSITAYDNAGTTNYLVTISPEFS